MPRDPRAFLWDVLDAAGSIRAFVENLDAAAYAANPLVYSAVERKFEIIGEALGQLAKSHPELAGRISDLAQIVAFRNQLIHAYAMVNHGVAWNVIHDALPQLLVEAREMLDALDRS